MKVTLSTCFATFLAAGYIEASQLSSDVSQLGRRDSASIFSRLGVDLSTYGSESKPARTCAILDHVFPNNETFTQQSSFYTHLYEIPWSQTCWLKPACVVTPNNPTELSTVIQILTALKTKFAVRGAGHKPTPGFNSIGPDGVLIALQNLKSLSISADHKTVTVGSGNRWRDVYAFAEQYDVQIVGGREPMVGVSGFLLGGGVNLFVNSWGLAIDLVSRFQVVLTDGSIVNATPNEHTDLFKALKGGLANFGIVTEFDIMTLPSTKAFYFVNTYKTQDMPALLDVYGQYLADPSTDPRSSVEIEIYSGYAVGFFGYDSPTNLPKDFQRFASVPKNSTLLPPANRTLDAILALGATASTLGSWVGVSFTHKVTDGDFMKKTNELFAKVSATLPPTMFLTYFPQGILPNSVTVSKAHGGNVLGVEPTPQVWVDLYMTFTHLNETAQATKIVNDLFSEIISQATAAGLALPYIFSSTASNDQKPLRSFGEANFDYIKMVAKKYDPEEYMQTLQNDGYLIVKEE